MMKELFDGIKRFNASDFIKHKDLFASIGKKTKSPHLIYQLL
ncbi:MAG: hypothetical protein PHI56_09410 [Victivallaceae bacterium]|nr:hypothetical protein [Victivallaceae bacterium]MDD3117271.1 hypothetical protein [Victivallaceae bacterium]MDD3704419.1 hypothetical protein [Victivallaceae bacterium]MDD5664496.1 hypothetical protein [Victivallaceae bacterium]